MMFFEISNALAVEWLILSGEHVETIRMVLAARQVPAPGVMTRQLPRGTSGTDITDLILRLLLICISKPFQDFNSSFVSSKTLQISPKNNAKPTKILILNELSRFFCGIWGNSEVGEANLACSDFNCCLRHSREYYYFSTLAINQ